MFKLNHIKAKEKHLNFVNIIDTFPEPFQDCTVFDIITSYPSLYKNIIIEKIDNVTITHIYSTDKDAEYSYEKYYKNINNDIEVL